MTTRSTSSSVARTMVRKASALRLALITRESACAPGCPQPICRGQARARMSPGWQVAIITNSWSLRDQPIWSAVSRADLHLTEQVLGAGGAPVRAEADPVGRGCGRAVDHGRLGVQQKVGQRRPGDPVRRRSGRPLRPASSRGRRRQQWIAGNSVGSSPSAVPSVGVVAAKYA